MSVCVCACRINMIKIYKGNKHMFLEKPESTSQHVVSFLIADFVTWPVPRHTAAILAHVLCSLHATTMLPVYSLIQSHIRRVQVCLVITCFGAYLSYAGTERKAISDKRRLYCSFLACARLNTFSVYCSFLAGARLNTFSPFGMET